MRVLTYAANALLTISILSTSISTVEGLIATSPADKEIKEILSKLQEDVLEFRDIIVEAYANRCNAETVKQCGENNYDDCTSVYPGQICLKREELVISECGDGDTCNALWSKLVSSVSIPAALAQGSNGNPTDPELIETVCYTRQVEDYMKRKYKQDEEFWAKYGVTPGWTYFGAHNGVFRIYPSTQNKQCGLYDTRKRPYFIAASSGPKDIVLVIDVSGSMGDHRRLDLAIEAARTIVETLTVADRVAVITFSDDASLLGRQDKLIRATAENKAALLKLISDLSPQAATNFHAAFLKAFDTLDNTIAREESTTGCNIAVLFLTDGMITAGPDREDVVSLVQDRTQSLSSKWDRDVFIFTYSLGISADHEVTKEIACKTGGVWTPVDDIDFGGDLVTSMSSYYKLFAVGLGEGDNEDFTGFVEPYEFYRSGKMGTTVFVPVYYRGVSPPLFLGVAAKDLYMDAHEQILGESATTSTMLDRFIRLSTAYCPKIKLSECELDALRMLGGGPQATCGACNSSDFAGIVPEKCRGVSDYPNNVWENTDMEGRCCKAGESVPSETCAADVPQQQAESNAGGLPTGAIVSIAVGGTVVAMFLFCCYDEFCRRGPGADRCSWLSFFHRPNLTAQDRNAPGRHAARAPVVAVVIENSGTYFDGLRAAPVPPPPVSPSHVPPSAPPIEQKGDGETMCVIL